MPWALLRPVLVEPPHCLLIFSLPLIVFLAIEFYPLTTCTTCCSRTVLHFRNGILISALRLLNFLISSCIAGAMTVHSVPILRCSMVKLIVVTLISLDVDFQTRKQSYKTYLKTSAECTSVEFKSHPMKLT